MNNTSTHTKSSFFFLSLYASIFLFAFAGATASSISSECLITRQILPSITLTTLGTTNTTDTYSLNYEITKGFYSGCYDIQVSFVTTGGTFKSTNFLERRDNSTKTYSEVFKFAVVIPQHKIRDVCNEQGDLNSDEVRCKIILKLVEKPTSIVTGYFEDTTIVKTQYPNDINIKRFSYVSIFPFWRVRIIKFTPLVNNEGFSEHVFVYEMNDNNEESKRNSRSSAAFDENANNSVVSEEQVQVNDFKVDGNIPFQGKIDYQLETFNAIAYSLLNNSTEYTNDHEQLQQFKANNSLRLQLLNYPSTEIFSLKLGRTTTTFLEVANQHGQVKNSNENDNEKDKNGDIDLKDQNLIQVKQDNNDPFLISFQHKKSTTIPSFSIIQEVVFISKPTVLKQIIISQYFQLNYSDNNLQVIYLPSISDTLTQPQKQSTSIFDSIVNKNPTAVIVLGIFIICILMLVFYLRISRNRLNIVGALKQTFSASKVAELERIEIKQ